MYTVTDCAGMRVCTGVPPYCSAITTISTTTTPTTPTPTTIDLSHVDCSKCDFTRGEVWRPDVNDCHGLYIV